MTRTRLCSTAALAAIVFSSPAAYGQSLDAADVVTGEIRPGWRTAQGSHMAALHLRLAEGWKTYWRAPGDAGIPPRFNWQGTDNIATVTMHWPRPVVFRQLGARSIGYSGELVLPLEFTLRDPDAPARVSATVEIGVCEQVCIPVSLGIESELPRGGARDAVIVEALERRPESGRDAGLRTVECAVEPVSDGLQVTASIDGPALGRDEVAIFELADRSVWISEASSRREGRRLTTSAEMVAKSGAPFALDRSTVRITILGDERAAELHGCPSG